MDKELEVLEEIGNVDLGDNPYKKFDTNKLKNVYGVEFATLYRALTELKAIKEAKPSEAMNCLEKIKNRLFERFKGEEFSEDFIKEYEKLFFEPIKQCLIKAQEQENVLNGIIKHLSFEGSGVEVVKDFINDKEETKYIIKVTSKDTGATIHIHLDTKEESELLKRWSEK